jgi:hypothetical protein
MIPNVPWSAYIQEVALLEKILEDDRGRRQSMDYRMKCAVRTIVASAHVDKQDTVRFDTDAPSECSLNIP